MAKHKYTAADFGRYYSGQMPEAEMHALEKSALEDPFLADALEGYAYTKSPATDVAELKERVSKTKRKPLFFLQSKTWLRIAASILVVGISYLVFKPGTNNENLLAKLDVKEKVETKAPDSLAISKNDNIKMDTIGITGKEYAYQNTNKKPSAPHDLGLRKQVPTTVLSDSTTKSTEGDLAYDKDAEAPALEKKIAGVKVNERSNAIGTPGDSLQLVTIADGYKMKSRAFKQSENDKMVMKPSKQTGARDIVAINDAEMQRRDAGFFKSKMEKNQSSIVDSAYGPRGGWQNFNQYVRDNINIPLNDEGKKYSGNSVVSFEVNKRGRPVKVIVEQSICEECDKEAIRLLREGPKWKYGNRKRYFTTISF